MELIGRVSAADVLEKYNNDRGPLEHYYERKRMSRAFKNHAKWSRIVLERDEINNVLIPEDLYVSTDRGQTIMIGEGTSIGEVRDAYQVLSRRSTFVRKFIARAQELGESLVYQLYLVKPNLLEPVYREDAIFDVTSIENADRLLSVALAKDAQEAFMAYLAH